MPWLPDKGIDPDHSRHGWLWSLIDHFWTHHRMKPAAKGPNNMVRFTQQVENRDVD